MGWADAIVLLIAVAWILNGLHRIARPRSWWRANHLLIWGDPLAQHVQHLVKAGSDPPPAKLVYAWSVAQIVAAVVFSIVWLSL